MRQLVAKANLILIVTPCCNHNPNPTELTGYNQSTSVGSQCRSQTDTSIFSVWARHTNAVRPTLAAVSGMHRFQVICAHSYRCLHGLAPRYLSDYIQSVVVSNRRRLRSSSSSQLVIRPFRRTRLSTVGDRAFSVAASKLISFPDHFLPVFRFLVLHTVYSSGLAIFVL